MIDEFTDELTAAEQPERQPVVEYDDHTAKCIFYPVGHNTLFLERAGMIYDAYEDGSHYDECDAG